MFAGGISPAGQQPVARRHVHSRSPLYACLAVCLCPQVSPQLAVALPKRFPQADGLAGELQKLVMAHAGDPRVQVGGAPALVPALNVPRV